MVLTVDLPAKASFNVTAGRLWLGCRALLVVRCLLVVFRLVVLCGVVVVGLVVVVVRRVVVVDTVVVEDDVINRCVVDLPILFTAGFLVARTAKSCTSCGFLACVVREGANGLSTVGWNPGTPRDSSSTAGA